ncbi:hypothetical protein LTR72_007525 [Exophiala xenobiotica]|nr:hypothetical protein LTR72_007525 [Exophiala xenobiotica]KAK5292811.1 hypothetical protein LTR14_005160 [Exophiala xenobiotica]KAK5484413.1 hypothetical protein LTR55_005909 [Exophiala xenobiotica]
MATPQPEDDSQKALRAFLNAKQAYQDAIAITETNTKNIVVLNFKALQLLRIKSLQQELFDLQMRFQLGGYSPDEYSQSLVTLDSTLQNYAQALMNYDILAQNSLDYIPNNQKLFGAPDGLTPCQAPSEKHRFSLKDPSNQSTEFRLSNWRKYTLPAQAGLGGGDYILHKSLKFRELDRDGRETRARKSALAERFAMALFGGAALIAPMLIMTLHSSQSTSLITVSLATFLFALAIAIFANDAAGKDVLAATAAYAAVLVVFVGTNAS